MDSSNNSLVKTIIQENDMMYQDVLILRYKIKYPEFTNNNYPIFVERVNGYYALSTALFIRFDIQQLYQLGLEDYKNSQENDIPFRHYEFTSEFEVTYNEDCLISTYTDGYKYTGGAHGTTERRSSTWNLSREYQVLLTDLFLYPSFYEEYITNIIIEFIEKDIESGNDIYFDDYKVNVVENFDPKNFYLTKDGVVIYFQQYDIAPYSSGILTFLIPYEKNIIELPQC